MKRSPSMLLLCAAALTLGTVARADVIWNEGVNGDFSNNGLAPTALTLTPGNHSVIGLTGDAGLGVDRDYFSIFVPAGSLLTSVVLLDNTTVSGSSAFIGIQAGPQMTVSPTGAGQENLLGFAHYGTGQIGLNLMPLLAPGFSGGLPSGTYSLWVQELGGPVEYGFDFGVTAVPLPAAGYLLVSGLLGFASLRKRRALAR